MGKPRGRNERERTSQHEIKRERSGRQHEVAAVRRDSRADEARQLIRLRQKIKTENVSEEATLLASLDKATAELDAGKGIPIERVRKDIREWAKNPKNTR